MARSLNRVRMNNLWASMATILSFITASSNRKPSHLKELAADGVGKKILTNLAESKT